MKNEEAKIISEGMHMLRATWWVTFLSFRDHAQDDLQMDKEESVAFALKATSSFMTSILHGFQKTQDSAESEE